MSGVSIAATWGLETMTTTSHSSRAGGRRHAAAMVCAAIAAIVLPVLVASTAWAAESQCAWPKAVGLSRIVSIDTRSGPYFGDISKIVREPTFLAPKEVVLTFDDGPMPGLTRQILDTLDRHCTKATFFQVGRMAIAYPGLVKEVLARGHTVGTHTWSHPLSLRRLSETAARAEIEKGFAAVQLAAGEPISPFFRFPGLNDTPELLTYLQGRGIASFTVDVISDDSYIQSTERLIQTTLRRVEARNGGILLFHDIKASTARALPAILAGLQERGFTVVHLQASSLFVADQATVDSVAPLMARASPGRAVNIATAFAVSTAAIPMTHLAPPARIYGVTRFASVMTQRRASSKAAKRAEEQSASLSRRSHTATVAPWSATIQRSPRREHSEP